MPFIVAAVQGLHVIAAVLWVGGAAFLEIIVVPTTTILPLPQQRLIGRYLGTRAGPFFAMAGAGTLALGVLRGTLLGPIQSLAALGSRYGLTWLVALLLTGALGFWGARMVGPEAERLYADASLWVPDAPDCASAVLEERRRHLAILTRIQLAGFAAVIVCMMLMAEVFS
jgi:hypothetical protein